MSDAVNLDPNNCTVCDGDTTDNIWFQLRAPGFPGKCKLDDLTYEQVHAVLERVPQARAHLLKITSDPVLIRLANTTRLRVAEIESNKAATDRINANTLPYYTVLRGNTDGSVH